MDEETRRKEELRARMARLGGGMPGMGAPFNPFGAPPPAPSRKKQAVKEAKASQDAAESPSQQIMPMVPVPGMQRMQSPDSDTTQKVGEREVDVVDDAAEAQEPPLPPKRSSTMGRGAPPPVPKGKSAGVRVSSHPKKRSHPSPLAPVSFKHRSVCCYDSADEVSVKTRGSSRLQL